MHLRRSKERDRHHIMAIARKFSDSINLADKKERLADAIGTDKVIVACHDDDKTMGFIYAYLKGAGHHLYKPGRSEVLISALCVDSTHHRKGAGKALLNELVKSNGHHKITCAVDATNKAGMSLFQKCGFKINGKICSFMREQPLEVTATLDKALLKHLRPFEITSAEIDPDKESFDIPEEAYEVPAGAMKLLAEAFLMDKKLDSTAKGKDSVKYFEQWFEHVFPRKFPNQVGRIDEERLRTFVERIGKVKLSFLKTADYSGSAGEQTLENFVEHALAIYDEDYPNWNRDEVFATAYSVQLNSSHDIDSRGKWTELMITTNRASAKARYDAEVAKIKAMVQEYGEGVIDDQVRWLTFNVNLDSTDSETYHGYDAEEELGLGNKEASIKRLQKKSALLKTAIKWPKTAWTCPICNQGYNSQCKCMGHSQFSCPDGHQWYFLNSSDKPIIGDIHVKASVDINRLQKKLSAIKLDVEKGDVILRGKFLNQKETVREIGEDSHGSPTINGKSILRIRLPQKEAIKRLQKKANLLKLAKDSFNDEYLKRAELLVGNAFNGKLKRETYGDERDYGVVLSAKDIYIKLERAGNNYIIVVNIDKDGKRVSDKVQSVANGEEFISVTKDYLKEVKSKIRVGGLKKTSAEYINDIYNLEDIFDIVRNKVTAKDSGRATISNVSKGENYIEDAMKEFDVKDEEELYKTFDTIANDFILSVPEDLKVYNLKFIYEKGNNEINLVVIWDKAEQAIKASIKRLQRKADALNNLKVLKDAVDEDNMRYVLYHGESKQGNWRIIATDLDSGETAFIHFYPTEEKANEEWKLFTKHLVSMGRLRKKAEILADLSEKMEDAKRADEQKEKIKEEGIPADIQEEVKDIVIGPKEIAEPLGVIARPEEGADASDSQLPTAPPQRPDDLVGVAYPNDEGGFNHMPSIEGLPVSVENYSLDPNGYNSTPLEHNYTLTGIESHPNKVEEILVKEEVIPDVMKPIPKATEFAVTKNIELVTAPLSKPETPVGAKGLPVNEEPNAPKTVVELENSQGDISKSNEGAYLVSDQIPAVNANLIRLKKKADALKEAKSRTDLLTPMEVRPVNSPEAVPKNVKQVEEAGQRPNMLASDEIPDVDVGIAPRSIVEIENNQNEVTDFGGVMDEVPTGAQNANDLREMESDFEDLLLPRAGGEFEPMSPEVRGEGEKPSPKDLKPKEDVTLSRPDKDIADDEQPVKKDKDPTKEELREKAKKFYKGKDKGHGYHIQEQPQPQSEGTDDHTHHGSKDFRFGGSGDTMAFNSDKQ